MKRWRVLVNGTNFQLPFEESKPRGKGRNRVAASERRPKVRRMGFYTTVFVTARSPKDAELRGVNVIRRDKALRASVRNAKDDPPRIFIDEIVELQSFRGCRRPRVGLAFYAERGRKREK